MDQRQNKRQACCDLPFCSLAACVKESRGSLTTWLRTAISEADFSEVKGRLGDHCSPARNKIGSPFGIRSRRRGLGELGQVISCLLSSQLAWSSLGWGIGTLGSRARTTWREAPPGPLQDRGWGWGEHLHLIVSSREGQAGKAGKSGHTGAQESAISLMRK